MKEVKEGVLTHREDSPTAANATDRKFPPSGKMTYAVTLVGGMGQMVDNFDAYTGDEAAELALAKYVGARVAHVAPAQKQAA